MQLLEGYCEEFLYTNVDKEGLMQGTDMAAIRAVAAATERKLTAAGGITTRAEIDADPTGYATARYQADDGRAIALRMDLCLRRRWRGPAA